MWVGLHIGQLSVVVGDVDILFCEYARIALIVDETNDRERLTGVTS